MSALRTRYERARRLAEAAGLDGLYVTAGANFTWLTEENAHPGGWPLWASVLIVPVDGDPALVVSKMHADIFDLERIPVDHVFQYVDGEDPAPALRAALASAGVSAGQLGADDALWLGDADLLAQVAPEVRLRRSSAVFDRLRAVKDAAEVEHLRKACAAHDAGYRRAFEVIRPGVTVAEAGAEVVRAMLAAGSGELALSGVFHHLSDRPFAAGEVVDLDLFPGSHGGYHADTARNLFLGEPSAEARRLYAATHAAYDAAMAAVRPGVPAQEIHRVAAATMEAAGYRQVWKIGHGVGLAPIHEPPLLQVGNDEPLEEGMVFTIDPGAFLARDTPIHIEDTVLVTADGAEALNRFPLDLESLIVA
ncbi:M24 family metallopeptidase [Conexibacter arvalis]|uniref:Xaa-Pro aminopeptidase n=1 Tax=Conexibacter arvalis TaxID=912552 RepID=A0A840IB86_9ACTN|nr:Xaa-Pro peptidase family protein [Conexibacter arvalis]MBB4661338.1 Xaa-Pro aminopeptidase [Conexibacter arvalis]